MTGVPTCTSLGLDWGRPGLARRIGKAARLAGSEALQARKKPRLTRLAALEDSAAVGGCPMTTVQRSLSRRSLLQALGLAGGGLAAGEWE
jgi:hypothetical protein